ncbi:MAG TPA: TIGR03067 domain-containing protein [Tepidisphaeraceae bacterium]|nr:TIGR03067 domain-containing protein [Tepidisphaeraceae bacterium]
MRTSRAAFACLIVVFGFLTTLSSFAIAKEATDDLAKYQGSWEWVAPARNTGEVRRTVKEIQGSKETVTQYDKDGKVVEAHVVDFSLEDRDGVKVFTFKNWETTGGPNKGQRRAFTYSYIYRLSDDVFVEANGLLPQEAMVASIKNYVKQVPVKDADGAKKALESLRGNWKMVSGEEDGKPIPKEAMGELSFDGQAVTLSPAGRPVQLKGESRIDPSQSPGLLDLVLREGPDGEPVALVLHAIYQLEGDELRVCVGLKRPTSFAAPASSGQTLMVLKRGK